MLQNIQLPCMIAKLERKGLSLMGKFLVCNKTFSYYVAIIQAVLNFLIFNAHHIECIFLLLVISWYQPTLWSAVWFSRINKVIIVINSWGIPFGSDDCIYFVLILIKIISFIYCRWNATFHDYSSHLAPDVDYSMC